MNIARFLEFMLLFAQIRNAFSLSGRFLAQSRFGQNRQLFRYRHNEKYLYRDEGSMDYSTAIIKLSESEKDVLAIIKAACDDQCPGATIRVAGGWVRDKLLGLSGKPDIDIALDTMTGRAFALVLSKWCHENGKEMSDVGIIQQNPEKSKHLETATVHLGMFEIDLVNLRTDTYSDDSRIPVIEIGTPEQDAFRRDLTINALFFNVHKNTIEDFTGQGLDDLRNRLVRTPLPALTTLLDDPLRALRAIRFACRLQFNISPDLLLACTNDAVRAALTTKVSPERVTQELEQMLLNRQAARAATLLWGLRLMSLILSPPPTVFFAPLDKKAPVDANAQISPMQLDPGVFTSFGVGSLLLVNLLRQTASIAQAPKSLEVGNLFASLPRLSAMIAGLNNFESNKILSYAALTLLTASHQCANPTKKKRPVWVIEYITLHCLRMRSKDTAAISKMHLATSLFKALLIEVIRAPSQSCGGSGGSGGSGLGTVTRYSLGSAVRAGGASYEYALTLACCELLLENFLNKSSGLNSGVWGVTPDEVHALTRQLVCANGINDIEQLAAETSQKAPTVGDESIQFSSLQKEQNAQNLFEGPGPQSILQATDRLVQGIDDMNLSDAWAMSPLLAGEELSKLFKYGIPKGREFGQVMDAQIQWMLTNQGGHIDDLKASIRSEFSQFDDRNEGQS